MEYSAFLRAVDVELRREGLDLIDLDGYDFYSLFLNNLTPKETADLATRDYYEWHYDDGGY